jgi:hypothetical protein
MSSGLDSAGLFIDFFVLNASLELVEEYDAHPKNVPVSLVFGEPDLAVCSDQNYFKNVKSILLLVNQADASEVRHLDYCVRWLSHFSQRPRIDVLPYYNEKKGGACIELGTLKACISRLPVTLYSPILNLGAAQFYEGLLSLIIINERPVLAPSEAATGLSPLPEPCVAWLLESGYIVSEENAEYIFVNQAHPDAKVCFTQCLDILHSERSTKLIHVIPFCPIGVPSKSEVSLLGIRSMIHGHPLLCEREVSSIVTHKPIVNVDSEDFLDNELQRIDSGISKGPAAGSSSLTFSTSSSASSVSVGSEP